MRTLPFKTSGFWRGATTTRSRCWAKRSCRIRRAAPQPWGSILCPPVETAGLQVHSGPPSTEAFYCVLTVVRCTDPWDVMSVRSNVPKPVRGQSGFLSSSQWCKVFSAVVLTVFGSTPCLIRLKMSPLQARAYLQNLRNLARCANPGQVILCIHKSLISLEQNTCIRPLCFDLPAKRSVIFFLWHILHIYQVLNIMSFFRDRKHQKQNCLVSYMGLWGHTI